MQRSKMIPLFSDIMLLEAGNQAAYNYGNIPNPVWMRDYMLICKKHNTDTATLRKTFNYLQQHPETYSKLLEDVITRLQKEEMAKSRANP